MLLFRNLRGLKACLLGCVGVICLISGSAKADVCFLPNGGCVALDSLGSTGGADENCSGYGTEIKGQGWDCSDTCSAHGHIYYHCVEKSCGTGYQPGVSSCPRGYTHEYEKKTDGEGNETFVYSGYSKCGKCQAPEECPIGTQKSSKCEDEGYKARETQYYVGTNVCYICLDDNCKGGKKKYCSWSSGSKNGPSGSNRATSDEWYTSTALTQYGSTCYACCNNKCRRGSQEVTSCNANTELLRTLEYTACGSACNECCNNVCSSGSLNVTSCSSGHYMTTDYTTECGNSCNSCHDCGGYRESEKPTGCYNCIPRQCGGETRYDCTKLSNTCSVGSTSSSCAAGYKAVANDETTECGNTCYSCECDDVTLFKTKQKCQTAADGTIYICSFNANRTCYKRDRLKCDPADGLYATKELCEKTLQVSWLDLFEKSLEEFSIISASYASPNLNVDIDVDPVLAEVDPTCEQCLGWFECNPLTQKSIGAANGWSGGTEYFGERIITRAKCNDMCGYEIPTICSDEHGDDDDDDSVVDDEYECVSNADECWYKRKKCSPLDDETPDTSTCKTTSYSCSDDCGGTRTCYKYACNSETQTCQNGACVNCVCPGDSKHDNELTCSGNYTKLSVISDNCGKPCYDCVCQLSCGTNQTLDSDNCECVCKPQVSETPDASTCKTVSYACDDGCGGTRTCYKSACGDNQTCQNGTCVNKCSPLADETPDASTCKTVSYACDDGCGGTRTCYKSACNSETQICQNGTCVDIVDNCGDSAWIAEKQQICHDAGGGQVIGVLKKSSFEISEGSCVGAMIGWCNDDFYYCDMCDDSCSPLSDETPNTNICKTISYGCDDGCGGTRTCYKYACNSETQTCQNGACVNCVCPGDSKHDNELTCSGNYTKTSVAPDNCGKPCYDCVCQLSCGTNQTLDSNTCTCVCKPKASETPDTSTCKTMPYACDDGCGGTRTCYKYACNSETQTCQNGACVNKCSPLSDETPDTNTCKTVSYSCDDGCGGTRTCYKSACGDNQTCQNGTCVNKCSPLADETPDASTCKTVSYACDDGCGGTRTCYKSACNSETQTCQNGTCVNSGGDEYYYVYMRVKTFAVRTPVHPSAYETSSNRPASDAIRSMRFVVTEASNDSYLGKSYELKPLQRVTSSDFTHNDGIYTWKGTFTNTDDSNARQHWSNWSPSLDDTVWRAKVPSNVTGYIEVKPMLDEYNTKGEYVSFDYDADRMCSTSTPQYCIIPVYGGYALTDDDGEILTDSNLPSTCQSSNCTLTYNASTYDGNWFVGDILELHPYVNISFTYNGVTYSGNNNDSFRHYINDTYVVTATASRQLASPIKISGSFDFYLEAGNGIITQEATKTGTFRSCPDDSMANEYLDAPCRSPATCVTYADLCASNFAAGHSVAYLYANSDSKQPVDQAYYSNGYHFGGFLNTIPSRTPSSDETSGGSFSFGPFIYDDRNLENPDGGEGVRVVNPHTDPLFVEISGEIIEFRTANGHTIESGKVAQDGVIYNFPTEQSEPYQVRY